MSRPFGSGGGLCTVLEDPASFRAIAAYFSGAACLVLRIKGASWNGSDWILMVIVSYHANGETPVFHSS